MKRTHGHPGALVAALALLLVACGSEGGDSASGSGAVDPNGVLNVGYTLPAMPMDPHKTTTDLGQFTYASLVYDRLTKIEPGPELAPMLAESWEFADDGMSIDFHLRDDVSFTDGVKLDAEAVKASLDRAAFDPESTVSGRFTMIDSIVVVDPLTVRIVTNRKAADLPYLLAGTAGAIISPDALDNPDLDVEPVGSGPYVVTDLKLGEATTYERRDDYWGPEEGMAKTIKITGIPDENARLNSLRSGQIDLTPVSITAADQAEQFGDGFKTNEYPLAATWDLFLNTTMKPMDDVRVRQALNYAVDRDTISKTLLNGLCSPESQPLAPGADGYLDSPPVDYSYDPEKAKELLAEAGYPDGFSAKMLLGQGLVVHEVIASVLQAQLAEVGVDLEIVKQDPAQAPVLYGEGGYETYMQTRTATAASAVTLSSNFSVPRFPGPVPTEFSDAVAEANDPQTSAEAATAALETASAVANEEAFDVFICAYPTLIATSDHVEGGDQMGVAFFTGTLDLRAISVLED